MQFAGWGDKAERMTCLWEVEQRQMWEVPAES